MSEGVKNCCSAVHFCTAEHPYVINGECDCEFGQPRDDSGMSLCRHYADECGEYVNLCRCGKAQEQCEDYYDTH